MIAGLQYRAAAWAGAATQFFWGFMLLSIYLAFYRSGGGEPPMPWPQLASYIWLQQAFLALFGLWWQDNELLSSITNGHVAYELCRPCDLYAFWSTRLLAMRLSNVALRCLPILTVTFFLPATYRLSPPAGVAGLLLFLLSITLAALLNVAVSMFVYILTFITLSPVGSRLLIGVASEFMMGSIIPIPLMPVWIQRLLNFFPFRYISDLPLRLWSGNIYGREALFQIMVQLAWLAGLCVLGHVCFRRVCKRVVVQGG
jgi:ABC-2 type transport system permease protein